MRADGAIDEARAELEMERQRADQADQAATSAARERDPLQERVDKLIRQLDDAAADNQETNRRLQDFEARRQLELADDQGRTQIDELLRVTQERLAGQTEKLITAEDRVRALELEVATATERADVAEAENRTHQMSDALREMREQDVATTRDAVTQREISAATSAAIDAGSLEDRRSTSPLLSELSMDAKKSLAKIDGITKLHEAQEGREGSSAADEAARDVHAPPRPHGGRHRRRREPANGTVELAIKRTDMEALINRVVEESGADADNDIRVVADPLKLRIDASAYRTDHAGLLRTAERADPERQDDRGPAAAAEAGAMISVEDPGQPRRPRLTDRAAFAEIQGGWIKAEALDGRHRVPRVPARRRRHRRVTEAADHRRRARGGAGATGGRRLGGRGGAPGARGGAPPVRAAAG